VGKNQYKLTTPGTQIIYWDNWEWDR